MLLSCEDPQQRCNVTHGITHGPCSALQRSALAPALKKEVKSPADSSRRASHAARAGETRPGLVHRSYTDTSSGCCWLQQHQHPQQHRDFQALPASTDITSARSVAGFQLRRAGAVGSGRGGQTHVAGKPARGHCGRCCTSKPWWLSQPLTQEQA